MQNSRRALLKGIGAASIGGLSGCIGIGPSETSSESVETQRQLDHRLQAELVGDSTESNAQFGAKVAMDGDGTTAFVTAYDQNNADEPGQYERTGALYIFEKSGGTWSQKEQFVPDELGIAEIGGEIAVSGDGTTALLEITSDDVPKAVTFEKSDGSWASETELPPPTVPEWSEFGRALALSADGRIGIVTEVRSVEIDSESQPGVAYVFERPCLIT